MGSKASLPAAEALHHFLDDRRFLRLVDEAVAIGVQSAELTQKSLRLFRDFAEFGFADLAVAVGIVTRERNAAAPAAASAPQAPEPALLQAETEAEESLEESVS